MPEIGTQWLDVAGHGNVVTAAGLRPGAKATDKPPEPKDWRARPRPYPYLFQLKIRLAQSGARPTCLLVSPMDSRQTKLRAFEDEKDAGSAQNSLGNRSFPSSNRIPVIPACPNQPRVTDFSGEH